VDRRLTPPVRIVSLVPSLTELLADLGLDDEVVGLTRFCVRPECWKKRKAIVGGTKNVRVDRVEALRPDLVIANREENVREEVEAIAAFAPVHVTDMGTVEEALAMIQEVGRLVGRAERAEALAAEIEAAFGALPQREPLRAAYLIWRHPYMTVGGDTFISDVMARGGLANVFGDRTRYPEVTAEDLAAARPDVVLLSSEPYPFGEEHVAELAAALPGVPIRLVDGELFSWYGSRMRYAATYVGGVYASAIPPEGGVAR
jgi:ABC-type Fe3+-hydroxamate transport system substrate-binding protein